MYVHSAHTLLNDIRDTLPDLKKDLAVLSPVKINRIDRYIQLCLTGGLRCMQGHDGKRLTSLVLATGSGMISTVATIMEELYCEHNLPKPLQFIRSLTNSACYHLARVLDTAAPSIAVSQEHFSFEAALIHAQVLSMPGGQPSYILVGGVDEAPLPIGHQLARFGVTDDYTHLTEGSHWLLLATEAQPGAPFQIRIGFPEYTTTQGLAEACAPWLADRCAVLFNCTEIPPSDVVHLADHPLLLRPSVHSFPHRTYSAHNFALAAGLLERREADAALVISKGHGDDYCVTPLWLTAD